MPSFLHTFLVNSTTRSRTEELKPQRKQKDGDTRLSVVLHQSALCYIQNTGPGSLCLCGIGWRMPTPSRSLSFFINKYTDSAHTIGLHIVSIPNEVSNLFGVLSEMSQYKCLRQRRRLSHCNLSAARRNTMLRNFKSHPTKKLIISNCDFYSNFFPPRSVVSLSLFWG